MQFILQIFPWYSAICMFFKTKYFSFQPKTFKARLLSIVVNISGKKLFFITNFQGCKVMRRRRRCSDSLLSASLLPVGRAARKNCESVLRDNFFLISCHILLHKNKIADLANSYGNYHHFVNLPRKRKSAKLFLKRNSKEIFCFLSFIFWVTANYFLGDKNWIMVVKSLSKTISLSWRQIGNTFFSKHFLLEQNRGWS